MKKVVMLGLVIALVMAGSATAASVSVSITNHSFEDDGVSQQPSGWTVIKPGAYDAKCSNNPVYTSGRDGGWHVFSTSAYLIQTTAALFTAGDTLTLTVAIGNRSDKTANGGWDFGLYYDAAGTRTEVARTQGTATWTKGTMQDVTLQYTVGAADACLGSNIIVQLGPQYSANSDHFDNVRLSIPKFKATNPTPADGAHGLLPANLNAAAMSWDLATDPEVTGSYISLDTDPNFAVINMAGGFANQYVAGNGAGKTYIPGAVFTADKVYYWRVDTQINGYSAGDPNNTQGYVWTFDTMTAPTLVASPVDAAVFAGESGSFTATFDVSTAGGTVKWYKDSIEISSTPLLAGQNDYTYFIAGAALADEGVYQAVATNATDSAVSNYADLKIKMLLAEYTFDNTLAAVNGAGSAGDAPTGTAYTVEGLAEPNSLLATPTMVAYVDGFDGTVNGAVVINPNDYIDLGVTGYPRAGGGTNPDGTPNGSGRGLDAGTLICWVKPNTLGGLLSNGQLNGIGGGGTTFNVGMRSQASTANARLYCRNDAGQNVSRNNIPNRPDWDMFDNAWHMIAMTWEVGAPGALNIYVDGQQVAGGGFLAANSVFAVWQKGVLMGATRQVNTTVLIEMLDGAIDNLRVYNYRLDAVGNEVFAQEYYDATGIVPCTGQLTWTSDFNVVNTGDSYCTVDLADFAALATQWLNSGLYTP